MQQDGLNQYSRVPAKAVRNTGLVILVRYKCCCAEAAIDDIRVNRVLLNTNFLVRH